MPKEQPEENYASKLQIKLYDRKNLVRQAENKT